MWWRNNEVFCVHEYLKPPPSVPCYLDTGRWASFQIGGTNMTSGGVTSAATCNTALESDEARLLLSCQYVCVSGVSLRIVPTLFPESGLRRSCQRYWNETHRGGVRTLTEMCSISVRFVLPSTNCQVEKGRAGREGETCNPEGLLRCDQLTGRQLLVSWSEVCYLSSQMVPIAWSVLHFSPFKRLKPHLVFTHLVQKIRHRRTRQANQEAERRRPGQTGHRKTTTTSCMVPVPVPR